MVAACKVKSECCLLVTASLAQPTGNGHLQRVSIRQTRLPKCFECGIDEQKYLKQECSQRSNELLNERFQRFRFPSFPPAVTWQQLSLKKQQIQTNNLLISFCVLKLQYSSVTFVNKNSLFISRYNFSCNKFLWVSLPMKNFQI